MPDNTNPPTALDLRDLLALPHETFLPTAFTALMGREPDVVGLTHYALRLQRGASRVLILAEMRTSPEGQLHAPHAPSGECDALVRRYKKIRGLPLGRQRWNLLPQFGYEPPRDHFDWEHWATDYADRKARTFAATATASKLSILTSDTQKTNHSEQKLIALEQRVEALSAALQQALSLMQERGISTSQSAPVSWELDTAPEGFFAISAGEVSWAARRVYVQLFQNMITTC